MDVESVRVLFVIPENCKSPSSTSEIMQQTFDACKQNVMNVEWAHENDDSIDFSKTDFVVFEKFDGRYFDRISKNYKSARILGPMCLLVCLTEARPIPDYTWPILTVAMTDCVVACSNLPSEKKKEYQYKIQSMAGIYNSDLMSKCTHLVTDSVLSNKYLRAAEAGIKLMTPAWVDTVWEQSQERNVHGNDQQFQKHKCPVFLGLTVCSTGFSQTEKSEMEKIVIDNGGTFTVAFYVRRTNILICKGVAGVTSQKYKVARNSKHVKCVTPEWVHDSVKKGYALNPSDYVVKKGTSTPTKEAQNVDPDFSVISAINFPISHTTIQDTINSTTMLNSTDLNTPALKRKVTMSGDFDDLVDGIDIKLAKKAGSFLDGCGVYLTGFGPEQKEKLSKVLNFSGATRYNDLSDRITHIIVGNPKCHDLRVIKTQGCTASLVSIHWLLESMRNKHPVTEHEYIIVPPSNSQDECGSPLSKKGLNLLRTDNTIMEDDVKVQAQNVQGAHGTENELDIIQKYLQDEDSRDTWVQVMQADDGKTKGKDPTGLSVLSTRTDESTIQQLNIFEAFRFLITGFGEEEHHHLKQQIETMAGTVVSKTFKGIADYAVVPVFGSELYQTTSEVVNDLWVMECYSEHDIRTVEYFHRPIMMRDDVEPLKNCVITVSSYTGYERNFLKNLIIRLGGISQEQLAKTAMPNKDIKATTHLICMEAGGKKYVSAVKWNLPVINKDWLLECARVGKKVSTMDFLLSEVTGSVQKSSCNDEPKTPKETPSNGKRSILTPIDQVNHTPVNRILNFGNGTPGPCSQVTPVRKIMEQFGGHLDRDVPTPKVLTHVDTPKTPLGAFIRPNPSPNLRKEMQRYLNTLPDWKPPKPRRQSTPLSELKKQLWEKMCPSKNSQEENIQPLQPDFENTTPEKSTVSTKDSVFATETPDQMKINEQLKQLEDMVSASGGPRRSSMRKFQEHVPDPLPHQNPQKDSQVFTVGWDYMASQTSNSSNTSENRKVFMISGVPDDERQKVVSQLQELGVTVSESPNYVPNSTHLVCPKLARNEKTLACIAAGKWILHVSYVEECARAGYLLDEEEFEFGNPKSLRNISSSSIEKDAAQRAHGMKWWRKEISKRGFGAFHDMRAIVVASKRDCIVKVIEAGGGMVVDVQPPFDDSVYATHCLLEPKSVKDWSVYVPLAKQGIYCVNTLYISEFLQKSSKDIIDCILPHFKEYFSHN